MKLTLSLVTISLAAVMAASSQASTPATPRVDAHQASQAGRIQQGVANGSLTRKEAARLRAEQRGIRAEERAFKADGVVTHAERQQLRQDQRQASRHIYKKKHNARTVG